VHAVVALHPSRTLADLVQRMKGASAYELSRNARVPTPLRWQEGYWAESITPSSLRRVMDYVSDQRARHESGELAER
jgi:REP element-mobilizing transposase RayT